MTVTTTDIACSSYNDNNAIALRTTGCPYELLIIHHYLAYKFNIFLRCGINDFRMAKSHHWLKYADMTCLSHLNNERDKCSCTIWRGPRCIVKILMVLKWGKNRLFIDYMESVNIKMMRMAPLVPSQKAWWRHQNIFPRYWSYGRGIHRSSMNSLHKGQWRGALMFSLFCALNKPLSKQSWGWWFETPSRSLWRHRN